MPLLKRMPTSQSFSVNFSVFPLLHPLIVGIILSEEFGVTTNQATIYAGWWNEIISSGLTGDLIWQAGSVLSNGPTANDGFAVYPTGTVYPVMETAAAALKAARG